MLIIQLSVQYIVHITVLQPAASWTPWWSPRRCSPSPPCPPPAWGRGAAGRCCCCCCCYCCCCCCGQLQQLPGGSGWPPDLGAEALPLSWKWALLRIFANQTVCQWFCEDDIWLVKAVLSCSQMAMTKLFERHFNPLIKIIESNRIAI